MYPKERFTSEKKLRKGEFSVKVGSFKVVMSYKKADILINSRNNIGCIAFDLDDMNVTDADKGDYGKFDELLQNFKEMLKDTAYRAESIVHIRENPMFLMYSQAMGGKEILTMYNLAPPRCPDLQFRIAEIGKTIVCAHSSARGLPDMSTFYHAHAQACYGKNLNQDRQMLEKELLKITPRAQNLLEQFIELYARGQLPEDLDEE